MKSTIEEKSRLFKTDPDEDLLVYMEMANDNREYAEKAFNEFYQRHKKYVMMIIKKACMTLPDKAEAINVIFNNTFFNIYKSAHTFKANKGKGDVSLQLKAWIGIIAKNEFYKLFKEKNVENELTEDILLKKENYCHELYSMDKEEENELQSIEKDLLNRALDTLSERDRLVLLTYVANEQEGNYMPRNILEQLAEMSGTTKTNLRKIKERSMKKVQDFINANSKSLN